MVGLLALLPIATMIALTQQQGCTSLKQEVTMYGTVGESQEWDMRKYFFTGQDLDYKLSSFDSAQFQVRQSVEQINPAERHGAAIGLITGVKPLRQYENGVWLNSFIFLEQDSTSVDIFYSTMYPSEMDKTPKFSSFVSVRKDVENFECFDLDFITPTIFLADCTQTLPGEGLKNGFLIVDATNHTYENIVANDNPKGYKKTLDRKIVIHEFSYQLGHGLGAQKNKLLIRGEPAYASEFSDLTKTPPVLDSDCEIEVFRITGVTPSEKATLILDKNTLAGFVKRDPATFKFTLIDFQVEPNGDIYILDAYNGVFIVTINAGMEWVYKDWIAAPYVALAYAFDFNYLLLQDGTYQKHLVMVYETQMNTFLNGVQQNGYTLPFKASFGYTQVQMSQEYVVLRNLKTIYLYSSTSNLLINTDPMDEVDVVLINPYEPDLVGLSQYSAHRYLLSNGFLRLLQQAGKTDSINTISVIATPKTGKECNVIVKWQILDKNDSSLYDLGAQPFPSTLSYPSPPIQIDLMASGPNLKYAPLVAGDQAKVILSVRSVWDLKMNGITLPEARDVVFSDILATDDSQRYYLLLQTTTKIVYIYNCYHNQYALETADCKPQTNFTLNVQLSKKTHSFSWWTNYNQIIFLYQDTNFTISIYSVVNQDVKIMDKIVYDDKDPANQITSFTMLYNCIYVVQEGKQEVDVWSSFFPIIQIATITPTVMANQGFRNTFNPKRVFGNKKLRSQIIFIQTMDTLIMGDFAKTFTMLKTFPILPGSEIEVAIGTETLFIAMKNGAQQAIDQYNYKHLTKVYRTQTLPLYHYKIQEPLTVDYSALSGWIFVRALDTKTNKTVILVYEPNVLNHITLHKVLDTMELIDEKAVFDMAVDGNQQMFLYFNDNKMHKVLAILQDAIMLVTPTVDAPIYVNHIRGGVQITNFPQNQPKDIIRDMTILNTQSAVQVLQAVLDSQNGGIQYKKEDAKQTVNLGTKWYHGQATAIYFDCNQCYDHLTVVPPVHPVTDGSGLKVYDISDAQPFGSQYIVHQTRDALVFSDFQGALKKRVELRQFLSATQSMELVTCTTDAKFTFSSIIGPDKYSIIVTSCTDTDCAAYLQGVVDLPGLKKVSKIQLIDNKFLVVLNSDPENFKSYEGNIMIYTFTTAADGKTYSLSNPKTISSTTFGATSKVYPGDFDIIEFKVDGILYYKVIVTDIDNGFGHVDAYMDNTGTFQSPAHVLQNLRTFSNDQYYISTDTLFHQARVLSFKIDGQTLKARVLITTSNVAHYVFSISFDISKPQLGSPIIKNGITLLYVLTPYGTWKHVNKLSYNNGYVAIPYSDTTKVTVGVYKIPENETAVAQTLAFLYGVTEDYHNALPIDFELLVLSEGSNPFVWTNIKWDPVQEEHLVIKYAVAQEPVLQIVNGAQLNEQNVTIHLENAFGSSQGRTRLSTGGGGNDETSSGSSNWWWITLLVIFGVALVGGVGFFVYQKFYKSRVDPLLG